MRGKRQQDWKGIASQQKEVETGGIFGTHDCEGKEGSRWWKFRDIKHN